MNDFSISVTVFVCVFGGALVGMYASKRLPEHHLSSNSKDLLKVGIALLSTMVAMVLGLQLGSAKGIYDTQTNEITELATKIIVLDRSLAQYGAETKAIRQMIRTSVEQSIARTWPSDAPPNVQQTPVINGDMVYRAIRGLTPTTDNQRDEKEAALRVADDIRQTRWLLMAQHYNFVATPLIVVVVSWVTFIFIGFGILAPRNSTVVITLVACASAVSGAIFLILEMYTPFSGLIRVSSRPLLYVLEMIGS